MTREDSKRLVFARCCDEAEKHQCPFLSYPGAVLAGDEQIDPTKTPPRWLVGVWVPDYDRGHFAGREVRHCPFCGKKLPEPWPRKDKPESIHQPQDGNYCGTCDERNMNCQCFPLEWHWEWPKMPRCVLSNFDMEERLRLAEASENDLMDERSEYERGLRIAMQALKQISDFGHVGGPHCCSSAPVYECGCYDKSQWDIAREAIERINRESEEEGEPKPVDPEVRAKAWANLQRGGPELDSECDGGPDFKHDKLGEKCPGCKGVVMPKDEEPVDDSVRIGSEGVAAEVGFLSETEDPLRVPEERLLKGLTDHYRVSPERAQRALEVALDEGAVRRNDGWIEAVLSRD